MMSRTFKSFSFDAKKQEKNKFKASTNAEREFYRALRRVAKVSGHIVDAHSEGADLKNEQSMIKALNDYSKLITPWARRQSAKLLEMVSKSNARAYNNQSKVMGKALKLGVARSDTGKAAFALLNEQVALIQSIPIEAGQRAQKIAAENFINGTRANPDPSVTAQLKKDMGMSTQVAINRAKLISRTETARANASFVEARAVSVGVQAYIWRTTMDGAERESHKKMNGKLVRYDDPPILSDGTQGHAGTFPNCRCYQDPVLPEDVK